MSAAAFDLAIVLKSLRDFLEATEVIPGPNGPPPGSKRSLNASSMREQFQRGRAETSGGFHDHPRALVRANSSSQLDESARSGAGVSRSISTMNLSSTAESDGFSTSDILDDYLMPQNQPVGDGITQDLVSCLSNLVLAVKILAGPSAHASASEAVKVAAQALAKTTKLLISSAIAFSVCLFLFLLILLPACLLDFFIFLFFSGSETTISPPLQNQVEINGRRELFNNEISDLLLNKGAVTGSAYTKIHSDEYPTIPTDTPFLPLEVTPHSHCKKKKERRTKKKTNPDQKYGQ